MNNQSNEFVFETLSKPGEALEIIGRLFVVAEPGTIYSEPMEVGDYTVITASELLVTMGAGYGGGGKTSLAGDNEEIDEANPSFDGGGGGGGGGFSMGRPVASITIGPEGVRVDPIVDPTKIAIAFFTTLAAMVMTLGQIWRTKRK